MELAIAKEKDIEIRVVKWFDNRSVRVLTNMASVNPIGTVQRWDKKQKKYIEVPIPDMITQYNQHMGGVDLLDMLIALYRIHLRSRKWYHRILFNFLDLALVNSWFTYRLESIKNGIDKREIDTLLQFKVKVLSNSFMLSATVLYTYKANAKIREKGIVHHQIYFSL